MSVHHGKLHHKTPAWVPAGARFHVRISADVSQHPLSDPVFAVRLLSAAIFYHGQQRWHAWLFLLMPDHLHAVISFPKEAAMSRTVGDWKKYQTRELGIKWQDGYFDHRLRNDDEFAEKCHYIRMNPVRAGLCAALDDWPWMIEPWKVAGHRCERRGVVGG